MIPINQNISKNYVVNIEQYYQKAPYLIKYNLLLIPLEPSTLALLHTNRNNCSHQLKHAELHFTRYIFYSSHITGRKIEKSLAKPHMKVEHRITTAMAMVPKRT
jgi:hypothetical protein